jgi:hypothetical protein
MTSSTSASRWHALVATSTQARARKTATDHHENEKRKAIQVSAAILYASTRLLRDLQDSEEQYSTNNAESTPAAPELIVTRTGGAPTAPATVHTENAPTNNAEGTPATPAHSWRYNAMYAATFTLSALLSYITIEAMRKRGRGRN